MVAELSRRLIEECVEQPELKIDYLSVYARDKYDYHILRLGAEELGGKEINDKNGPVYRFRKASDTDGTLPKRLIRVRQFDPKNKLLFGCVDFVPDDYRAIRQELAGKSGYLEETKKKCNGKKYWLFGLTDSRPRPENLQVSAYFASRRVSKILKKSTAS